MFSHCKPARLPALDDNWLKHLAGGTGDPSSPKRRNLPIAWIALKRVSPRKESMRIPSLRLGAPVQLYLLLAIELLAVGGLFASSLSGLYSVWSLQPEYSHGLLLPVLSAYLIWRQREDLKQLPFTGSWGGLALIAAGLVLRLIGQATTMVTFEHYAFLLVIYGLVLALAGPAVFRRLWMPLVILVFAVPLPSFLYKPLSLQLQLLSSQLGVSPISPVEIMRWRRRHCAPPSSWPRMIPP